MREKAIGQTFDELMVTHKNVETVRKYGIVSQGFLQFKFERQTDGMSVAKILQKYPLATIMKYALIAHNPFSLRLARELSSISLAEFKRDFQLKPLKDFDLITRPTFKELDRLSKETVITDELNEEYHLVIDRQLEFLLQRDL
jgi:hypothetical protein